MPVVWLHERYTAGIFFDLVYTESERMLADVFTKTFPDVKNFHALRTAVGITVSKEEVIEESLRRSKLARNKVEDVDAADAADA